ncbi:cytochrome b561 and DOMON domain-containing protein At5g35735-like [Carica papaya]|uniref:cytochrome b561 and DOMON domain-containing protein At5g35735-like n=1 Tax=Carica papaya TaxID=3649 RepID=UPI000B8CCAF1|nr:cytochrome b561 and DOMON domain-containing protein At5g35735-like [Carica papaya]
MGKALMIALFSCLMVSMLVSSSAQQACEGFSFSGNRVFRTCVDLPVLNSFLHWNFNESSSTAEIAFRHTGASPSNWVAWALNPTGQTMIGSQAIVAFQNSSGQFHAFTTPITSFFPSFTNTPLRFGVSGISASFVDNEAMIFATLELTNDLINTNQVWQVGPLGPNGMPNQHLTSGPNMMSVNSINFQSGQTTSAGGDITSRIRRRNIHGVLNAVSWGILMPIGAMLARYVKVFKVADPAWFYMHVVCQFSAYVIGVSGFGTGLKLGSESPGFTQYRHRNIGITLFVFGTLQVFALLLRPKPNHKYRFYWNIYHHSVGYSTIILSIVNVFKGLDILNPDQKWKRAYIGILIFLGCVAVVLEALTWFIVLRRKRVESDKLSGSVNGTTGVNQGV